MTSLRPEHLIAAFIVAEDDDDETQLSRLPHVGLGELGARASEALKLGIPACKLFVFQRTKTPDGAGGLAPDGLMPRAIREVRSAAPGMSVQTEVCACAYTTNGECVLVDGAGGIDHAATHEYVGSMARLHAREGADVVVAGLTHPGSVHAMRRALDASGFEDRKVMASIQFRSSFYGSYRAMMNTEPRAGNRLRAHIDPDDVERALRLVDEYTREGASMLKLQPIMSNIAAFIRVRERTSLPLAAFSVSAEIDLVCDAKRRLDPRRAPVAHEYFLSLRRAGADFITTYLANEMAAWMHENDLVSLDPDGPARRPG